MEGKEDSSTVRDGKKRSAGAAFLMFILSWFIGGTVVVFGSAIVLDAVFHAGSMLHTTPSLVTIIFAVWFATKWRKQEMSAAALVAASAGVGLVLSLASPIVVYISLP